MTNFNNIVNSAGRTTSVYAVTTLAKAGGSAAASQVTASASAQVSVSSAAHNLAAKSVAPVPGNATGATLLAPVGAASVGATVNEITLDFGSAIQRGQGLLTITNAATGKVVETINVAKANRVGVDGNTMTIHTNGSFDFNTKYKVSFAPGAVKDGSGTHNVAPRTFNFQTGKDNVAPTVTAFAPPDGQTGVPAASNIAIKFSEAVIRGSGLVTLRNDQTGQVVETFDMATSDRVKIRGNVLSFDPTHDLADNTRYTVSFGSGAVRDLMGNGLATGNHFAFTTDTDKKAPTITATTPVDDSQGASPTAGISIKFSEAIQRGNGLIAIKNVTTGKVVELISASNSSRVSLDNDTLTIKPTRALSYNSDYQITLASGSVTDLQGNRFTGTSTYNFKTAQGVDDLTPPTIAGFSPTAGAIQVDPATNISVLFSEDIQRGQGTLQLTNQAGDVVESFDVAKSQRISISGNRLTIDPTQDLAHNSVYKLSFASGAVRDLSGNDNVEAPADYAFQTAAENVTPPPPPAPVSQFSISVTYTGDAAYQSYFTQAANIWQNVILGDLPDINGVDDLHISAQVTNIDGVGQVLGQAAPVQLRGSSYLPFEGIMSFDSADMVSMASNGSLLGVVLHEMGHVLGLGTLWSLSGFNSNFGEYTGSNALATYRQMSGNNAATYVPLETNGGGGTANAHWSEAVFDTELMTGYAEANGNMPLSQLTVAALQDLGYQVNTDAADAFTLNVLA